MFKKIALLSIVIIFSVAIFISCGSRGKKDASSPTPTPIIQAETNELQDLPEGKIIGVSLSDDTPFNQEFQKYFEQAFVNSDYKVITIYADGNYNKQVSDLADMLSKVEILILNPTDLDNLEYILSEYEVKEIPVINLIESVNASTRMLLGPFYRSLGKEIGYHTFEALSKLSNQEKFVVILRGSVDSSKMQGIYDGVIESLEDFRYTTLVETPACNYDYEKTKGIVTRILSENAKIHCIFAETSEMAIAAIDAIDSSGKSGIFITTIGADKDCMKKISDGRIDAAIFYGPNDLASATAIYTERILENKEVLLPQFVEMNYEIITSKNVAHYNTDDSIYALAAKGTELPPDPTPELSETNDSEMSE